MQNNNKKFGSLYNHKTNTHKEQSELLSKNSGNLFFEPFSNPIFQEKIESKQHEENQKFLNDIDSTLIMENIDNSAKNRVVKIDLKLKTLERNIAKVSEELKVLELFNLEKDKKRRDELSKLKNNLQMQVISLKSEKKKYGIFYILAAYTNNKINLENLKILLFNILHIIKKYYNISVKYLKKQKFVIDMLKIRG